MTVAAVMLVRDEVDIIEYTLRHLAGEVDEIFVLDNASVDGTAELLGELYSEGLPLRIYSDPEVGYYQDRKTTDAALKALEFGHEWVVPCDADEFWYAPDGRPLRDYLAGLAPDVAFVRANLYNHIPSAFDVPDPNPFVTIGWRQREHGALGKVCCRLRPGLEIGMGNHAAWAPGTGMTVGGLVVRHYSWRTREQYVRKIENGARAYAATDKPESVGAHWRMFGLPENDPDGPDGWRDRVGDHFERWFYRPDPAADETLIYDPAPMRQSEHEGTW